MADKFLFETLLMINHLPCYYKVYCVGPSYIYEPLPHHFYNMVTFPDLVVNRSNNVWNVIGVKEKEVIGPLISELERHIRLNHDQQ